MSGTDNETWVFEGDPSGKEPGWYKASDIGGSESSFTDAPYSLSDDKNTLTVNMGNGNEEFSRVKY